MRVLQWIVLPLVSVHLILATFSGYRAIWQIRRLDLRMNSTALGPGSVVGLEVESWGRAEADAQLELIQGAVAETLATTFLPRNHLAVYDSRPQRGAASVVLTTAKLARFTTGPAILRATAYGSMQWLRTPPPTIRQQRVALSVLSMLEHASDPRDSRDSARNGAARGDRR